MGKGEVLSLLEPRDLKFFWRLNDGKRSSLFMRKKNTLFTEQVHFYPCKIQMKPTPCPLSPVTGIHLTSPPPTPFPPSQKSQTLQEAKGHA